jgi:hypothetical protein
MPGRVTCLKYFWRLVRAGSHHTVKDHRNSDIIFLYPHGDRLLPAVLKGGILHHLYPRPDYKLGMVPRAYKNVLGPKYLR